MVLRSFFRNKVTKIYLTIITILLIAISFLFASVSYLNKLCDEEYQKGSIVYVESKEDIYDELMNNEDIVNPYEIIKFDYTDEEIINKYNIFEYEVDEIEQGLQDFKDFLESHHIEYKESIRKSKRAFDHRNLFK